MRADIDHDRAQKRHPRLVAKIMRAMQAKHRRAGLPDPAPTKMSWYYEYAVPFGGGNLHVSLAASLGRRIQYHAITPPGEGMPLNQLPPEIEAAQRLKSIQE